MRDRTKQIIMKNAISLNNNVKQKKASFLESMRTEPINDIMKSIEPNKYNL